jgi:outer membrane immunogenic protein
MMGSNVPGSNVPLDPEVVVAKALRRGFAMKSSIRTLLLCGACSLAIMGAASAADLGAIPLRGPVGMWNGLYAGVNGGYAWSDGDAVIFLNSVSVRPNPTGSMFGAQVGYNWQWSPDWVFGVETDIAWTDFNGTDSVSATGFAGHPFVNVAQQRVNMLGTLRGRVGFVLDGVLLYGTAGLAYGQTELKSAVTDVLNGVTCGPAGFCSNLGSKQWATGWAAGVGFDWAFLPQWSFRTEYLHYDLGSVHQNLADPLALPGLVAAVDANFRGEIVRGAINYKFW